MGAPRSQRGFSMAQKIDRHTVYELQQPFAQALTFESAVMKI